MTEFNVNRADMAQALAKLQGLTKTRSNMAITENVLIKAENRKLLFRGTDLETDAESSITAEITAEGRLCVNAARLHSIVKNFPEEKIPFCETENQWLRVGNGTSDYNLICADPDDFPYSGSDDDEKHLLKLKTGELRRMTEQTVFIRGANDDKRAHICGVLIQKNGDGKLDMVSTDGCRLAAATIPAPKDTPDVRAIVPKKGLSELLKFLPATDDEVSMAIAGNYISLSAGDDCVRIRLLEGDFPDFAGIITTGSNFGTMKPRVKDFLGMLTRMSIFTNEEFKGIHLDIRQDGVIGNITASASHPDMGDAKEEVSLDMLSSLQGDVEVAFNIKFLRDGIRATGADDVILMLQDDKRPCIIRGLTDDGHDMSFVNAVMPMRI